MKLKVFIVSSHLKSMGGAEKNVLDLARGLRDRCDIEIGGLQSGALLESMRAEGLVVHDLKVRRLASFSALRRAIWLRRKLKSEAFDVVVTYHHDADIWAGLVAMSAGVPVVSSRRDLGFMLTGAHVWVYRFLNRLFTRIIAVSEAVATQVIRTQWAPRRRVVVVNNGLRPISAEVDAAAIRRELGLDPTRRIVGTVANFRPIKGQEYFIRAAAEVARQRDDVQFVVVGSTESEYFAQCAALIAELGLVDRFHCVGDRKDVQRIIPAFEIFVLSSVQEGFSNALVEAMSAGVPPVASSVGGNPEAIEHGKNGFLFAVGDSRALARHLTVLLGDHELRQRMGASAEATVLAKFSLEGMIDKVYDVFLEASGREAESADAPAPARTA